MKDHDTHFKHTLRYYLSTSALLEMAFSACWKMERKRVWPKGKKVRIRNELGSVHSRSNGRKHSQIHRQSRNNIMIRDIITRENHLCKTKFILQLDLTLLNLSSTAITATVNKPFSYVSPRLEIRGMDRRKKQNKTRFF